MPLEVSLWEGGFEAINDAFEGDKIDAFVASEVCVFDGGFAHVTRLFAEATDSYFHQDRTSFA